MTNNVPGIGFTTSGVNPYTGAPQGNEPKPEDKKPETTPQAANTPQVKPDDVLSYMANSAVGVNPTFSKPVNYDVSKYVTPEQAARIAGFVAGFENAVAEGLAALDAEFGDGLSDEAKLTLAASMV